MKYRELDNYLRFHGFTPILAHGSHIKYIKDGSKLHVLIRRRKPHAQAGKGLLARAKRIVEGEK
jgi:predicted RNA binding protein YcfA (HicA-like mRNA interferase family)